MARTRTKVSSERVESRPALTPEARENQMIEKAVRLAERQLDDGTASSQVITHFLKLGTVKAQLEVEKLRKENAVLEAKAEAYKSAKNVEELYSDAIKAMQRYAGYGGGSDEPED